MPEEKLKLIKDTPTRYHFKTKDDQRVSMEHRDGGVALGLYKWGEEASLEIALNMVLSDKHKFLENRMELETPALKLRAYPIDTRSTGELYGDSDDMVQCEDGGLRFELVLKTKPLVNSFTIPIKSRNLRFIYQPFLTEQAVAEGHIRPFNVEGSYAVYHATKKNNQYMTGKAFHIYRPIAEDALGNKIWCALNIDEQATQLTITVPQKFLDEAMYPVTIDPDFGYTTIGGSWAVIGLGGKTAASTRRGSAWAMPAPGGIANYIKAYVRGTGEPNNDIKVFINQKDSGGAGTHGQIAVKENLAVGADAGHWEQFTLSGEALTSGVNYILSADAEATDHTDLAYDTDGAISSYTETQTYCGEESPWVDNPDGTTLDYSIYCNYTEAAVGLENKSANMGSKMVAAGLI